jgi:hypothetical protein
MSTIGKRVIYVGPADNSNHKPLNVEGMAVGAAILPGSLLKNVATGLDASDIAATVFGQQLIVADKDQQRTKSIDTAWTQNENMVGIALRSGEFANVLVATGQTLAVGDALSSNADGTLKKAVTDGTEEILCYADEAVTTAAAELVAVRVA